MESGPSVDIRHDWNGVPALRLSAGPYRATILPSLGGAAISLELVERGIELLRTPKTLEALIAKPETYGLPVLLFPNRIGGGVIRVDGTEFRFPINEPARGNHIHGFLHRKPYAIEWVETQGGRVAVLSLVYSFGPADPEFSYFPRPFLARQVYSLSRQGLSHRIEIRNEGAQAMPAGVGVHSNFLVPFIPESGPSDHELRVQIGDRWELNERFLATGRHLPRDPFDSAIAGLGANPCGQVLAGRCYSSSHEAGTSGVTLSDRRTGARLSYHVDAGFRFWVVWNKDGQSGFVSVEPQSWVPDAPNLDLPARRTGAIVLQPGEAWRGACRLSIDLPRQGGTSI